jgi:hypothetical protein
MVRARFPLAFALLACLSVPLSGKDRTFQMPSLEAAAQYPAHDQHTMERVTVGADPYDTPRKLDTFTLPLRIIRFLPILVVVTNDNDQPVTMLDMHVELVIPHRMKLQPAEEEDIARRMAKVPRTQQNPFPIPLPRGKNPRQQLHDEYSDAIFKAKAVEPHATQGGFFFFDISGISDPLAGASLIVSGLKDNDGKELFYFEISLDKYLDQRDR